MRNHLHIVFVAAGLLLGQIACQAVAPEARPTAPGGGETVARPGGASAAAALPGGVVSDEILFRQTLHHLQSAVATGDTATIRGLLYFPLLTAPQWTNDDLHDHSADTTGGAIRATDFAKYCGAIFHRDVRRLLPQAGESNLSEIERNTKENYYKRLARQTDPGSHLYELYMQYPDGYFGFVFGRIAGQYKVVSYYAKWPVT
jgi:hypothetical protein